MALPSNVGHGTVTGLFIDNSGASVTGKVTFTPTAARLLNPTAEPSPVTILPRAVTVDLVDGAFSQVLVATDDTDLNPVGWNYQVSFVLTGTKAVPFYIDVPEGQTVDLATVAPVAQGNGTMIVRGAGVPDWSTAEDGQAVVLVDGEPAWGDVASGGDVASVNGKVGTVTLNAADVGARADDWSPDLSGYATTTALTSGLAGKADTSHTHAQSAITGLSAALDAKADAADLGNYATSVALTSGLDGKANTSHTHTIANVTSLQSALDGKQAAGSYAAASHTHTVANVTGLQSALDGKVGSPDASVTGLVWVGSVESLPPTGSAGVVYFVDQA